MTSVNDVHIEEAIKQPKRYWNADGIPEIVMGCFWVLWSAAVLLPVLIPNSNVVRYRAVGLIVAMVAAGFLMPRIIRAWKQKVTYPRTGYVELRKPSSALKIAVIAIAGATAFGIALLSRGGSGIREWMPILLGILMSGSLVQVAWSTRSARLAILSPSITVAAVITTAMRLTFDLSVGVILLASGAVCVVDGLISLRGYLKAHPAPAGERQ
jgi:hypothetical protein